MRAPTVAATLVRFPRIIMKPTAPSTIAIRKANIAELGATKFLKT